VAGSFGVVARSKPDALSASLVVLTTGNRPRELSAALESARNQSVLWDQIVVVANGVPEATVLDQVGPGVTVITMANNIGIPAGRNEGVAATDSAVVVFLDDDATFAEPGLLRELLDRFEHSPELGAVSFRIIDEHGETARRHVPRLRGSGPTVEGPVTSFLGGASAVRRAAFDGAGGLPGEFFYALEETDLSWALIDRGWQVRYLPGLRIMHPRTDAARHPAFLEHTARNRILLARRRLPLLLGVWYVANWLAISSMRVRARPAAMRALARGTRLGVTADGGLRHPISWRTVWRLTRLGRPPII